MNRFIIIAAWMLCSAAFARDASLSPEVEALADSGLLPAGSSVPDKVNGYQLRETLMNSAPDELNKLAAEHFIMDMPLASVKPETRALYLDFRKNHAKLRQDLVGMAELACEVPKSTPMLTTSVISLSELMRAMMSADAVYIVEKKPSAEEISRIVTEQVKWSNHFLHCQGSMVEAIVGISMRGELGEFIDEFVAAGLVKNEQLRKPIEYALATNLTTNDLSQVAKRDYRYVDLWAIDQSNRSFKQLATQKKDSRLSRLFDLKETLDHSHKYYHQVIQALAADKKESKVDYEWFSEYVAIDPKLRDAMQPMHTALSGKPGATNANDIDTAKITALLEENPKLQNALGRTYLLLIHSPSYSEQLHSIKTDAESFASWAKGRLALP